MTVPISEIISILDNRAEVVISNGAPFPLASFVSGPQGSVDAGIAPGQEIDLTWQYWSFFGDLEPGISLTINIYVAPPGTKTLSGFLVYSSGSVAYAKGGISGQTTLKINRNEPSEPLDGILETLYATQTEQTFYMEVVEDSTKTPLTTASTTFVILQQSVGDWTTWNVHETSMYGRAATFDWNSNYVIDATFTNGGAGGPNSLVLSGQAALQQAQDKGGPLVFNTIATINNISGLNVGQSIDLNFPPIKQTWTWLLPFIWTVDGDISRIYQYQILYNLTDQFGNAYSDLSSMRRVVIAVSNQKYDLALGAFAAEVTSIALYALSWIITQVPGSLAAALAAGLGAAAKDPPSPSPKFRQGVVFRRTIRKKNEGDPRLDPLLNMLLAAQDFARLRMSMYEIEARVLGALAAKNSTFARAQKKSYSNAAQTLNQIAAEVVTSAKAAITAFDAWPEVNQASLQAKIIQWRYKPSLIDSLKISKREKATLKAALARPDFSETLAAGFNAALQLLAVRILDASFLISRDRFRVLNLRKVPIAEQNPARGRRRS